MDAGEKEIFIEGHPCVVVDSVRMRYRVASSAASETDADDDPSPGSCAAPSTSPTW